MRPMSGMGLNRTLEGSSRMSALGGKANSGGQPSECPGVIISEPRDEIEVRLYRRVAERSAVHDTGGVRAVL